MKPAINCITLAGDDLKKSLAFYRDGLGLPAQFSAELEGGADRTAFELTGDLWLVLMPRAEFAKCTKIANQPDAPGGSSECILSYFAASKEDVDAILKRANVAGGAVPGEAEDQPWGYSGYFTDPDGHLWEIMWKPALVGDATQVNRKHGVAPEVGAISFMRVLPGPIERVWAYLTEPEKREKWFASGPMEFRASGRVRRFSVPPEPASTRHHSRSSYGLGDPLTTVKQKCTLLYENQIKTDNTLCERAD